MIVRPTIPPTVLPLLREADYRQFQQIIPELQEMSFGEWLRGHQKAVERRRLKNGSKAIPVSPVVVSEWLRVNGRRAHLELLWEYAEHKAAQR